jgi:hypothetical protein
MNLLFFGILLLAFFEIDFDKYSNHIYKPNKNFIKTQWFNGSKISYSKNVFKNDSLKTPAIKYQDETGEYLEISWNSLKIKTLRISRNFN